MSGAVLFIFDLHIPHVWLGSVSCFRKPEGGAYKNSLLKMILNGGISIQFNTIEQSFSVYHEPAALYSGLFLCPLAFSIEFRSFGENSIVDG